MIAASGIAPAPVSAPLRAALGRFATGVAVVTTRGLDGRAVGLTVNSVASVSLDPPLLAWSLSRRTGSLAHFMAARTIAVHVLSDAQEAMARRFAASPAERFSGLDVEIGPGSVPLLKDVLARFLCTLYSGHEAGDHLLLLARITHWEEFPGEPLAFYGSRYCRVQRP